MIRAQFHRLGNSAKIIDIPLSGQKNTSDLKRQDNTMQHRELRAHRCSQIVNRTFQLDHE